MIDLASAVAPAVDAAAAEAPRLSLSSVVASMRIALAVRRGARSEDIAYSSRIAHQQ